MTTDWKARDYHLLEKNCNDFSAALLAALGLECPSWLNRLARVGNCVRCCLPSRFTRKPAEVVDEELRRQKEKEGQEIRRRPTVVSSRRLSDVFLGEAGGEAVCCGGFVYFSSSSPSLQLC